MMVYVLGLLGAAGLLFGADFLVRGASRLAGSLGVPPLVVGLTLVAFGTSTPELVVSLEASLRQAGDISLGNVVGSNIANIALTLGLAALLWPLRSHLSLLRRDVPLAVVSSAALALFALNGTVSRLEGIVLLLGHAADVAVTIRSALRALPEGSEGIAEIVAPTGVVSSGRSRAWSALLALAGLLMLTVGSRLFVDASVALARALEWSEAVIGLTIVAVGTSLPEMATSLVAAARGEGDIAAGNIVGSNIFNALGIAGISAVVHPLGPLTISRVDLTLMLVLAIVLWPMLRTQHRIDRWEGAVLFLSYAAYITWLLTR